MVAGSILRSSNLSDVHINQGLVPSLYPYCWWEVKPVYTHNIPSHSEIIMLLIIWFVNTKCVGTKRIKYMNECSFLLRCIAFRFSNALSCQYLSNDMTKQTKSVCAQRRLRSVWASAQSDQSLRCPHEETLGP